MKNSNSQEHFSLGELFCGPGGMALGARIAASEFAIEIKSKELSIEHVWGVDIDPDAIATYKCNLSGEGLCVDAMKFTDPNGKQNGYPHISEYKKINALAFGFPCNDFSMVGKQKGLNGKFGSLYQAGINAINFSDPLFFVAENVSGIHSANSGKAFKQILKELENAGNFSGYRITTHLYKFENYGVPQSRHRYLIVGIRKDQNLVFKVPKEITKETGVSAQKALAVTDLYNFNTELTTQSDKVLWRLLFTPPGENAWKLDEIVTYTDEQLLKYLKQTIPWYEEKIQNLGAIDIIRKQIEYCRLHCTRAKMSHIYKRLHPDRPSYTITGSGGGGTHVYHWEEPRALTNRERARLQSFPDDFEFKGSKEKVRKQIGMAVPPIGAKIIFKSILNLFNNIHFPFIDSSYD